ncbi:MAG: hypothetical protein HY731_15415 [Candidatus Tectomicrobia bacterium]|nr:hypothetical protein [Candidatus Tectomicrobia bacterium]
MPWNYVEFKDLCNAQGRRDSTVCHNALVFKQDFAEFHANQAADAWSRLFTSGVPISIGGQEWEEAGFAYEAYTEAAVQALHPMADILAQIINLAILGGSLSEDQVSLAKVKKKLECIASDVLSAINVLEQSQEFCYIAAFANTIKHRRLIDISFHVEYGAGTSNTLGFRFDTFSYKRHTYPAVWGRDILENYRLRVVDLICDIGNTMNDFLRRC